MRGGILYHGRLYTHTAVYLYIHMYETKTWGLGQYMDIFYHIMLYMLLCITGSRLQMFSEP